MTDKVKGNKKSIEEIEIRFFRKRVKEEKQFCQIKLQV